MTKLNYDLVVFGATSFVGQILTQYLAEYFATQKEQIRWAIAGRSQQKLQQVKDALGPIGQGCPDLGCRCQ